MKLHLYNTLTKSEQEFKTQDGTNKVRMYSCGPTVYNFAHIGNLRAYVFTDILKRTLKYNDFNVKHIMNITDIGHLTSDADEGEDKMVKALKRENKEMTIENMRSVAEFYYERFREDINSLNILPADEYPFASDHIKEDEEMINILIEKGFAYKISDGIYFDTSKYSNYGRLFGVSNDNNHGRINTNTEKRNFRDFALWKFAEKEGLGFRASFGTGNPGWHIECSVMSEKYLGVPFDIHTGGVDHIPVHHNNEIAQTECATNKTMANFWVHNEHITIENNKMAKSGHDFITLNSLKEKGIDPLAYRYWLLTSKYSTRIDFSYEALLGAQIAYNKLTGFLNSLSLIDIKGVSTDSYYKNEFIKSVNDNLNTPKAIALMWDLIKNEEIDDKKKKATILDFDEILGLNLNDKIDSMVNIPHEVDELLKQRKEARLKSDWKTSDILREKIMKLGYKIKDMGTEQYVDKIKYW